MVGTGRFELPKGSAQPRPLANLIALRAARFAKLGCVVGRPRAFGQIEW
jgi:hypothetical protein